MSSNQAGERFVKRYQDLGTCARAAANYRWLAEVSSPLKLPGLLAIHDRHLDFTFSPGVAARPADLLPIATHLGDVHGAIHNAALHRAHLGTAYDPGNGHRIPGFLDQRLSAIRRRLALKMVPGPGLDLTAARDHMFAALSGPVALYKDSNPRNFLIGGDGPPVTVDFDDLTLAPFGYDLAKLIVALAMTHGRIPTVLIGRALDAYNAAAWLHDHHLGQVTGGQLLTWAEIHHILTSPYLGCGGYKHSWHQLRPTPGELRTQPSDDGGTPWL